MRKSRHIIPFVSLLDTRALPGPVCGLPPLPPNSAVVADLAQLSSDAGASASQATLQADYAQIAADYFAESPNDPTINPLLPAANSAIQNDYAQLANDALGSSSQATLQADQAQLANDLLAQYG